MKALIILLLLIAATLLFLGAALNVAAPFNLTGGGLTLWALSRVVAGVFPPPAPPSSP